MPIDSTLKPWWLEPLSVGADLASVVTGLSRAEAKARLAKFAPTCSASGRTSRCCYSISPASRIRFMSGC